MTIWIQNPFDNLPHEGYRQQRYWLMALAFIHAGHDVVYWTSDFSHATKSKRTFSNAVSMPPRLSLRLIPTRKYRSNIGISRIVSHLHYAHSWTKLAHGETQRPDIIISSMPTISGSVAAIKLARHFGAKSVVDIQDAWPETFYRLAPKLLFTPLRQIATMIYRKADVITGVCDGYRSISQRRDYYRAYLGIPIGSEKILRQKPNPNHIRLIYAGNMGSTYDINTVIKAVEANNSLTLDIAGNGKINTCNSRIRFHGYLSWEALRELLRNSDLGIIPMPDNSFVGLPNKLFEYSSMGINIVSSLTGESAALLRKYSCGAIYEAGNINSLLEAINIAANLEPAASRRMCEAEFSAEQIYTNYVRRVVDTIKAQ